jgi:hypothetical protein
MTTLEDVNKELEKLKIINTALKERIIQILRANNYLKLQFNLIHEEAFAKSIFLEGLKQLPVQATIPTMESDLSEFGISIPPIITSPPILTSPPIQKFTFEPTFFSKEDKIREDNKKYLIEIFNTFPCIKTKSNSFPRRHCVYECENCGEIYKRLKDRIKYLKQNILKNILTSKDTELDKKSLDQFKSIYKYFLNQRATFLF